MKLVLPYKTKPSSVLSFYTDFLPLREMFNILLSGILSPSLILFS